MNRLFVLFLFLLLKSCTWISNQNNTEENILARVGNKILYHQHGGMPEYKVDGETVYIMSQNEVLSIVEE